MFWLSEINNDQICCDKQWNDQDKIYDEVVLMKIDVLLDKTQNPKLKDSIKDYTISCKIRLKFQCAESTCIWIV